jgi:hypothetical protein
MFGYGKKWWRKASGLSNVQRQVSRKLGIRLSEVGTNRCWWRWLTTPPAVQQEKTPRPPKAHKNSPRLRPEETLLVLPAGEQEPLACERNLGWKIPRLSSRPVNGGAVLLTLLLGWVLLCLGGASLIGLWVLAGMLL